jgi:hypothetical protein
MFKRTSRKLFLVGILSLAGVFVMMIATSSTGQIDSEAGSSFAVVFMGLLAGLFAIAMIVGYVFSLFEQHAIEERRESQHAASAAGARIEEETRARVTVVAPDGATKVNRVTGSGSSDLKRALGQLRAKGNRVVNVEDVE